MHHRVAALAARRPAVGAHCRRLVEPAGQVAGDPTEQHRLVRQALQPGVGAGRQGPAEPRLER
ncbi:MAG TPA: hypothetical protein VG411_09415, partial [Actinomycetota bacterium]|nr:hypothetical protein [Actinomycetota bacterium]